MKPGAAPFLILAFGVLIASTSSILIRYAQGAGVSSLAIGAWRMLIASAVLTPIALSRARGELSRLSGRDRAIGVAAGLFLALHFASWISSLEYTSVASSAALVTTNPMWVGIASVVVLRERLPRAAIVGIVITMIGSALILFADAGGANPRPNPWLGNALALFGAVAVSGYFLTGRGLRARVSLLAYVWIAYGTSALALTIVSIASGQAMWGYGAIGAAAVIGLALGPQLLGHTTFNWSLRRLSATFVALAILGEPIGSAVFAYALFGEHIGAWQATGFAVVLIGIAVAALAERSSALSQRDGLDAAPAPDPATSRR